jgi:hypothetical protein
MYFCLESVAFSPRLSDEQDTMHPQEWVQHISSNHVDPQDVISERLPSPDSSWLPVTAWKEYTLIFVVDEDQGRVRALISLPKIPKY